MHREAVRTNPRVCGGFQQSGQHFCQQGTDREGKRLAQTQSPRPLQPANAGIENSLAWMLVTAPQATLRNGTRAVATGCRQANQSQLAVAIWVDPSHARVLRTPRQEVDFPAAIQTAQRAPATGRDVIQSPPTCPRRCKKQTQGSQAAACGDGQLSEQAFLVTRHARVAIS